MLGEMGKPWPVHWQQLGAFVVGILFSYILTVIYRKQFVAPEYHRVFFFFMAGSFPFIFFASWYFKQVFTLVRIRINGQKKHSGSRTAIGRIFTFTYKEN